MMYGGGLLLGTALMALAATNGAWASTKQEQAANEAQLRRTQRMSEALKDETGSLASDPAPRSGKSALETLALDRFLLEGDQWVIQYAPALGARPGKALVEPYQPSYGAPVSYQFRVVQAGTYQSLAAGAHQPITRRFAQVEISILDATLVQNLARLDAPVSALLTVNDLYHGMYKTYVFADGRRSVVELEGGRSMTPALDRFPLELPNLLRAEAAQLSEAPVLPSTLPTLLRSKLAVRLTSLESATSLALKHHDAYGRPVTTAWRSGDVWPTYTSSAAGTSVLVSQNLAR